MNCGIVTKFSQNKEHFDAFYGIQDTLNVAYYALIYDFVPYNHQKF